MFTGLVEYIGRVVSVAQSPRTAATGSRAYRLEVELGELAQGLCHGDSVAVNGVCLTATALNGAAATFDVVPETWERTTLRRLRTGDAVNLERALRVGDRLGGHFVQGHVDGLGTVDRIERGQGEWKLWVRVEPDLMPAIVPKGSVTIDGTSLTVVNADTDRFSVALVPTTLEKSVLGHRRPGDAVNIETDILARLVLRQLAAIGITPGRASAGLSLDKLREGGYVS